MKNWVFLFALSVVIICGGCGESLKGMESTFTIKVTGSDDLTFAGYYLFIDTSRVPKPVNVAGTVPIEYTGKGITAVCVFHKTAVEGSLKVEILKDGKSVSVSETTKPYGIVSLGKIPEPDSIINHIIGKIIRLLPLGNREG